MTTSTSTDRPGWTPEVPTVTTLARRPHQSLLVDVYQGMQYPRIEAALIAERGHPPTLAAIRDAIPDLRVVQEIRDRNAEAREWRAIEEWCSSFLSATRETKRARNARGRFAKALKS